MCVCVCVCVCVGGGGGWPCLTLIFWGYNDNRHIESQGVKRGGGGV